MYKRGVPPVNFSRGVCYFLGWFWIFDVNIKILFSLDRLIFFKIREKVDFTIEIMRIRMKSSAKCPREHFFHVFRKSRCSCVTFFHHFYKLCDCDCLYSQLMQTESISTFSIFLFKDYINHLDDYHTCQITSLYVFMKLLMFFYFKPLCSFRRILRRCQSARSEVIWLSKR